jgi:hypothetical protein
MVIDCNRLWSQLATVVYKIIRKPRVQNTPPPK